MSLAITLKLQSKTEETAKWFFVAVVINSKPQIISIDDEITELSITKRNALLKIGKCKRIPLNVRVVMSFVVRDLPIRFVSFRFVCIEADA